DVGALRAVVIGDEADDEEGGEVAQMERGLDQARLLAREPPLHLGQRQYRGVGDEPGCGENAARAQRREPCAGTWWKADFQMVAASLTGMRRGPKGLPNFWKRPAMRVPQ